MIRRPPRSTRTDTLFPYTTLFRSLVTLVDRKSGYLSAYPVKRRTRRQVTRAINLMLQGHAAHTLTLDNGREFAGHERIALRSQCQVFFADPYRSEERRVGKEGVSKCRSRWSPDN